MSQFNYNDYQSVVARATQATSAVKVGFFKLADDGDEALVRINCASVNDLQFATVHTVKTGDRKWLKISCLNPIGSYANTCPLCAKAEANPNISKAAKKVYIQMLAAYKDPQTGSFGPAIPVVWERPAGFSREIAGYLKDYGNLKEIILKVTRNGAKGDMKTTYAINFIPVYNKPELVPADFSAFTNFNIAKHSYWEKTPEEIDTFIRTGAFPEVARTTAQTTEAPVTPTMAEPTQATPTYTAPTPMTAQTEAKESEPVPTRTFTKPATNGFDGFSF